MSNTACKSVPGATVIAFFPYIPSIAKFSSPYNGIIAAFEQLGIKLKIFTAPDLVGLNMESFNPTISEGKLVDFIRDENPICVISINNWGMSKEIRRHIKVPVVKWLFDDLEHHFLHSSFESPNEAFADSDFVVTYSSALRAKIEGLCPHLVTKPIFLPHATSIQLFKSIRPKAGKAISFIGSYLDVEPVSVLLQYYGKNGNTVPNALFSLMDALRENPDLDFDKYISATNLERCAAKLGVDARGFKRLLSDVITTQDRLAAIVALEDLNIKVYGRNDWVRPLLYRRRVSASYQFGKKLDDQRSLVAAYQASSITIDAPNLQNRTAISPRVVEAMASGALLITKFHPDSDLYKVFGSDWPVPTYSNLSELRDTCKFYSSNETERLRIVRQCNQLVATGFDFKDRVRQVLQFIGFERVGSGKKIRFEIVSRRRIQRDAIRHDDITRQWQALKNALEEPEEVVSERIRDDKLRRALDVLIAWVQRVFRNPRTPTRMYGSKPSRKRTPSDRMTRVVDARSPRRPKFRKVARSIRELFDADWYLTQNPDVAQAGINPLLHYVRHGAEEGRDPSPFFHSKWYLTQNPDVAQAGTNPLLHYVRHGAEEGRDPSPLFHSKWYLAQNPDVAAARMNPLQHYMEYGRREGRRAHEHDDDALVRGLLYQHETVAAARLFATMGPTFDDPIKVMVCPLTDLHTEAEKSDKIIANAAEIEFLTGATKSDGPRRPDSRASSRSRPSPYLAEFSEVMMLPGSSLIIDRSGRAFDDELDFAVRQFRTRPKRPDLLTTADGQLLVRFRESSLPIIDRGIHLCKEHDGNYFHWMVEILPRLFMIERLVEDKSIPLLVSDALNPNLYDLLRLVAHPDRPILRLDPSRLCRVRHLTYPSDVSRILDIYEGESGYDTAYLAVELIKRTVQQVKRALIASVGSRRRRLYLRRGSKYRLLLNDRELEERLAAIGFELLDLNGLSIVAQVELFSQAEIVVGPMGAAVANIVWCPEGTPVVVLDSDHPALPFCILTQLAEVCGARALLITGPRSFNRTDKYGMHDDFTVDASIVVEYVRELLD